MEYRWMIEESTKQSPREVRFLLNGVEVTVDVFAQWIRELKTEREALVLQIQELQKNLPCGHPAGCLEDDQCGLPEHRFCAWCDEREMVESQGKRAMKAETELKESNRLNGELVAALQHMKSCGGCAEDSWECCEGGRAALAAIEKATEKRNDEAPKFEFCRHAFNIGMNCIRERGHDGPCR